MVSRNLALETTVGFTVSELLCFFVFINAVSQTHAVLVSEKALPSRAGFLLEAGIGFFFTQDSQPNKAPLSATDMGKGYGNPEYH